MPSESNMDRAKWEERWFWIAGVPTSCMLAYVIFAQASSGERPSDGGIVTASFIGVAVMVGCAARGFRALKQEIADLKSGDSDNASVTESTDPPDEGSPTPESD